MTFLVCNGTDDLWTADVSAETFSGARRRRTTSMRQCRAWLIITTAESRASRWGRLRGDVDDRLEALRPAHQDGSR